MPEIFNASFPGGTMTLKTFGKELRAVITGSGLRAMTKSVHLVERHVKQLMTESPRGGREYSVGRGRRRRTHKASAPGEPPAVLSGLLRSSIHSSASRSPGGDVEGVVYSQVSKGKARAISKYASLLELGTRLMEPRPAWVRALREKSQEIVDLFRKEGI